MRPLLNQSDYLEKQYDIVAGPTLMNPNIAIQYINNSDNNAQALPLLLPMGELLMILNEIVEADSNDLIIKHSCFMIYLRELVVSSLC